MIYLRESTPLDLQAEITDYNQRMEFFRPVVDGEAAEIAIEPASTIKEGVYRIQITNTGEVSAVFLVIDLIHEGEARFTFNEGAISALHPGESVELTLQIEGAPSADASIKVSCLNAAPIIVQLPVEVS
jgi:hypothetical protein